MVWGEYAAGGQVGTGGTRRYYSCWRPAGALHRGVVMTTGGPTHATHPLDSAGYSDWVFQRDWGRQWSHVCWIESLFNSLSTLVSAKSSYWFGV